MPDKSLDIPPLYIITPTYRRPEQLAEITRLSHTLMLVSNLHWLVIEDALEQTQQVTEYLKKTGLSFDHLIGNYIILLYVFYTCMLLESKFFA